MQPIEIVYRSPALAIVNKPGGVLTQAPPGIDSVEVRLRQALGGAKAYVGCLHRLDRPVSGLLAFGVSRGQVRLLARQFEERSASKVYWAVVEGVPEEMSGRWVDTMRKVPDEPRSELVDPRHPDAQEAVLNWRLLASRSGRSLLEITLETGRTHQIRLQCSARLGPVLGDRQYGASGPFGDLLADERARSIALHARLLALDDPATGNRVELVQEPPPLWREVFGAGFGL